MSEKNYVPDGYMHRLSGTLTDHGHEPINLSGAGEVKWHRRVNGGEPEVVDVDLDRSTSKFTLPELDTSVVGTTYEFEAEISWGDGKFETVPSDGPFYLVVGQPDTETRESVLIDDPVLGIVDRLEAVNVLTDQDTLYAGAELMTSAQLLAPTLWLLRVLAQREADVVGILELLAQNLTTGEVDAEELQRRLSEMLP